MIVNPDKFQTIVVKGNHQMLDSCWTHHECFTAVTNGACSIWLRKSKKVKMELKLLRLLALEVFRTLINLNSIYMNELFQKTKFLPHRSSDTEVNISSALHK